MSITALTVVVLAAFLGALLIISLFAARSNRGTPTDYFLANRGLGTVVLLMTTGASFFSTWTLLGAIGSYYRGGVWFIAFAAWAVVHAMFIWLFGARIWHLGRKYGFVTPGDMVEKYYRSPSLRLLFAGVGIVGLVPYMLIQVTGGAMALSSLTGNDIPYWVGVLVMGLFVGLLVTLSGGRGAAWTDTFMGIFFGSILLFITIFFIGKAGWFTAFRSLETVAPEVLVNKGDFWSILDTALGLGLGFWVMPHMWQKFYSAKSPLVLAKTSVLTPFWNSWLMAVAALFIGIIAHTPGLIPGLNNKNSDQIIPLFFASYAPLFGSVVIAGVLAAGISTINSQLLSSASIVTIDIYTRFVRREVSEERTTWLGRVTVLALTVLVVLIAFLPQAQGFLVPLASLGFGISIQLVPAALGPLVWPAGTKTGAIASVIVGEAALLLVYLVGSPLPFGPATTGLIGGGVTLVVVSVLSPKTQSKTQKDFHSSLLACLYKRPHVNVEKVNP